MTSIFETLNFEMKTVFRMLEQSLSKMEGDSWKTRENNWMYGYVLFHALEGLDFHMSDSPDDWKPISEVSSLSQEEGSETLQTKDRTYFEDYLSKVKSRTFSVLEKYSDQDLLENDGFSAHGFISRLHKFSYVMRHAMVHVGELSKDLRSQGKKGIQWQKN